MCANEEVFGPKGSLFYIYAPRWTSASAGIRALHYLCHTLNQVGFDSYLVLSDSKRSNTGSVSEKLYTPILDFRLAQAHIESGRKPIVVYSETVPGNPLNSPRVVRYIMNYVGALGGMDSFNQDEFLVAYSQNIALDYVKKNENDELPKVLFIPAVDPREFCFKTDGREDFYLLYAGKYRAFVGKPPEFLGKRVVEIHRDGTRAQTRKEVIDLLSRCRAVISLENSSIITEAILSGAPGLFFPNAFLSHAIGEHELGWDGTGWGTDALVEQQARASVFMGRQRYEKLVENFPLELSQLFTQIARSLESVSSNPKLSIPKNYRFLSPHRIELSRQIIRTLGLSAWIRVATNFLRRRLSRRF